MVARGSPNDRRPPIAVAIQRASQITTIGFEMVLPAVGGYWLDRRWGTDPWLLIVGVILGFVISMYHLLQLVGMLPGTRPHSGNDERSNTK